MFRVALQISHESDENEPNQTKSKEMEFILYRHIDFNEKPNVIKCLFVCLFVIKGHDSVTQIVIYLFEIDQLEFK